MKNKLKSIYHGVQVLNVYIFLYLNSIKIYQPSKPYILDVCRSAVLKLNNRYLLLKYVVWSNLI